MKYNDEMPTVWAKSPGVSVFLCNTEKNHRITVLK